MRIDTEIIATPSGPHSSLWYLQHDVQDKATAVHYVLLRAPWAVLCYYAEDLRLKLPLQVWGWVVRAEGEDGGPHPGLHLMDPCTLGSAAKTITPWMCSHLGTLSFPSIRCHLEHQNTHWVNSR